MKKKIHIACDHAGFELKTQVVEAMKNQFDIKDYGTMTADSVDYPDYAHLACSALNEVYQHETDPRQLFEFAVLICGSGQGMNITANKYKNLRSALCYNDEITKMARSHNNAQVICLGSRFNNLSDSLNMIQIFSDTLFEGGRHQNRVTKIGPLG